MNMIKSLFPLSMFFVCVTANADHFDVYLLAGQSNMDGRGPTSDLTDDDLKGLENALIFYRNAEYGSEGWQPLAPGFSIPPKHKSGLPSPAFGPEIGFAKHFNPTDGHRLALIKASKGGTSLRADWKPGDRDAPDSQGPRYRDFVETIHDATEAITKQGDAFTIRGMLWHQGESDSKVPTETHQERLNALIERIREDLNAEDLDAESPDIIDFPVVLGQVFDNGRRDQVRNAIDGVAASRPDVGLVSAKGLTTWDEGTHFDAASQLEMGKRFADEMFRLQTLRENESLPTVVCLGDSITNRGYYDILADRLNVHAINAGVGGQTSTEGLRRLAKDVLSHHPDVTVILFGTNDMRVDNARKYVPVTQYRENLISMIEACRAAGSQVVIGTIPPINAEAYFTRHDRQVFDQAGGMANLMQGYQAAATSVAAHYDVPLVDLKNLLAQTPEWLSSDGVHPSPRGSELIAEHFGKAVARLLDAGRSDDAGASDE